MSSELIGILSVGAALLAGLGSLILTTTGRINGRIDRLEDRVGSLEELVGTLSDRVSRIEGLLDGLLLRRTRQEDSPPVQS